MRILFAFLLMLSFGRAISQQLPTKDGQVFYEEIDSVKGSIDELYS